MSRTFVIGDLHGHRAALERLLDRVGFDARNDRLWLVGDLVNRGPDSLGVLRWAREASEEMRGRFRVVLGNHDLHLIARADGLAPEKAKDALEDVLEAPDRDELVEWLRRRPFLFGDNGDLLVHAGLLPHWTVRSALRIAERARERMWEPASAAALLTRTRPEEAVLAELWDAVGAFTRLRTCTSQGSPCDFSGPPSKAPKGCMPWFEVPGRRTADTRILCGHWAALGLHLTDRVVALDTGAAWGGSVTTWVRETGETFAERVEG